MFEAIHGSAPRLIEEGLGDYASPASILKAEAMLLRHIGLTEKAKRLDAAVEAVLDMGGNPTCRAFADRVLEKI